MTNFEIPYQETVLDGIPLLRAQRQPCIICGHPTGDCADASQGPVRIIGEKFAAPRNGSRADDFLVMEDVFEEVNLTPRTRTKVLVARAGTYISYDKALQLGLIQ